MPRSLKTIPLRRILRVSSGILVVLLVVILANDGCYISVPLSHVDTLTISGNSLRDREIEITDAKRIEKIVAFVESRKWGWHKAWGTFPTPAYHVRGQSAGEFQFVVWISAKGGGWIGYRRKGGTSRDNLLRQISESERAELLELLDLRE